MEEGTRKYIPSYLRERYQLLGTVTFAALFSVLFLLVSIPFSNNAWFRLGNSTFFGFTALFASLSLAILIASKVTMYKTRNLLPMTYWGYSAWCLSEIALIAVLYTVFTVTIAQPEDQNGIAIFFHALVYTFVCLGVPYIIAGMFFTIIDQNRTIRLMNMQDVVTDETPGETAARSRNSPCSTTTASSSSPFPARTSITWKPTTTTSKSGMPTSRAHSRPTCSAAGSRRWKRVSPARTWSAATESSS